MAPSVLSTLYLIFNEGYDASSADTLVRRALCAEAIRLTRVLRAAMPGVPEIDGLLALMLLHDARRGARMDADGDLVLLERQNRSRWDAAAIAEGLALTRRALAGPPAPYALQAAIAAEHARAPSARDTDWGRIRRLYDWLRVVAPSPVVELNRAVAVAMVEGPQAGLAAVARIGGLERYRHYHSARAELLRRAGRAGEAAAAYERALGCEGNEVERRFLQGRRRELEPHT